MTTKELQIIADEIAKEYTPRSVYDYFNDQRGSNSISDKDIYNIEDGIWPAAFPDTEDWCINIDIVGEFDYTAYGEYGYEEYGLDDFKRVKDINVYEVSWDDYDGMRHHLRYSDRKELEELLKQIY